MDKKGKVVVEVLVLMITVVMTSAIIILLVKSGVIGVQAEAEEVNVLNAEFIPMGREGFLAVKDFKFCDYVDPGYNCVNEAKEFELGSEINFLFIVESSTYNGEVMLIENYRIRSPQGNIILEVDEKNNFHFDLASDEKTELITFRDFFVVGEELEEGEYALELFLENPLLDKKTTLVKKFFLISNFDDKIAFDEEVG